MIRRISPLAFLAFLTVTTLLGAGGPAITSSGPSPATAAAQNGPRVSFTEAELFFELNDTDGDLGIHASIDGGPWTSLEIEGPGERRLLDVISRGSLRRQGMTQLSFESAEPGFDELDPAQFFRRFPEGRYEITGIAQSGAEFESIARLSHVLPAPPGNILLSGVAAPEDCDVTPLPIVSTPVVIDWDPVRRSHPEIGRKGAIKIVRYQLFVERGALKLSLDLPPSVTEFEVPLAITDAGDQFKFEIIARDVSGNNTAVESCFRTK